MYKTDGKYRWPGGFTLMMNKLIFKNIIACSPEKDSDNIFVRSEYELTVFKRLGETEDFLCERCFLEDLPIVKMVPCNSEGVFAITKDGLVYHVKMTGCKVIEGLEEWFVLDYDSKSESFLVKKRDEKIDIRPCKMGQAIIDEIPAITRFRDVYNEIDEEYYPEPFRWSHNGKLRKLL